MYKIKLSLSHQANAIMFDREKLMNCVFYISLILVLGSSFSAAMYIFISHLMHVEIKLYIFQFIAKVCFILAQIVGLSALILFTNSKYKKHQLYSKSIEVS